MLQTPVHSYYRLFEREIERFRHFAQMRCGLDARTLRRKHRRYHRSWPLLVATLENGCLQEHSAALRDACDDGIGFMCANPLLRHTIIYVRLFWHEASALRIPALVRHVTKNRSAHLVGVQFRHDDPTACEQALMLDGS